MSRRRSPLDVLLAVALIASAYDIARPHGGVPAGLMPYLDEGGGLVGGDSNYGFLLARDEGFHWTPEENAPPLLMWTHLAGERLIAGAFGGMVETYDQGCSFHPVDGPLAGTTVGASAADPREPHRLWVATANSAGPNSVWSRSAAGAPWEPTGLVGLSSRLTGIEVEGPVVVVLARPLDAHGTPTLWRSDDEGARWTQTRLDGLNGQRSTLVGTAMMEQAGLTAVLATPVDTGGGDGDSPEVVKLWSVGAQGALAELGAVAASTIQRVVSFNGYWWALGDGDQLWTRKPSSSEFVPVSGASACLHLDPLRHRLWRCGTVADGFHFLSSADGLTWQGHLPFDAVCPARCSTPHADSGGELWEQLLSAGVGTKQCPSTIAGDVPDASPVVRRPPERGDEAGCSAQLGHHAPWSMWPAWAFIVLLRLSTLVHRRPGPTG